MYRFVSRTLTSINTYYIRLVGIRFHGGGGRRASEVISPYSWGAARGCDHLHKNSRRPEPRDFLTINAYTCLIQHADLACSCPAAHGCGHRTLDTRHWTLDQRRHGSANRLIFSQHVLSPSHQPWIIRNHSIPAAETRSCVFTSEFHHSIGQLRGRRTTHLHQKALRLSVLDDSPSVMMLSLSVMT